MSIFRIGVVGCGYWGPNIIRNFYHNPRVKKLYICDIRRERLEHIKSIYRDVDIFENLDELLKRKADAIVLATPPHTHFSLGQRVLEERRHLLVEKPMTQDLKEAERFIETAEKYGLTLMVGHTFLYNQAVRELKKIIEKGRLGKILYISSVRVNLGIFQENTDVIWDLASHDLSIFNFIYGKEPEMVTASATAHIKEGVWDVAFLNFFYRGGVVAHSHVSWVDPVKIRRITVVGDREMAVYDDMNREEPLKIYKRSIKDWPYYDTFGEFKSMGISGDIFSPFISPKEPLKIECEDFLDSIEKGKKPVSDSNMGLAVVKGLHYAHISLGSGGRGVEIR